jgi:hypothetical protein
MVYAGSSLIPQEKTRKVLTAPLAISLAETAYKAGRIESAMRYLNIAYAILDSANDPAREVASALPPRNGGTAG